MIFPFVSIVRLSRQHFNLFDVGSPVEIPVIYDHQTAKTTAQHYHAFTYKHSTSSFVAEQANNLYFRDSFQVIFR